MESSTMNYNYNDYDFERFYADVNGYDFDNGFRFSTPLEQTYDSYTGASEELNYLWN